MNDYFWSQDFSGRRQWLAKLISEKATARKTSANTTPAKSRAYTRSYCFPSSKETDEESTKVCKIFFLRTLGLKTAARVNKMLMAKRVSFEGKVCLGSDKRGGQREKRAGLQEDNVIIDHIESFNPTISHYTRENAPNRRYLDPELSVKILHDNFLEKYPNGSGYSKYLKLFRSRNIGFSPPQLDKCKRCISQTEHLKKAGNAHNAAGCDICANHEIHRRKYTEAREEYQTQDTDDGTVTLTADMQRVLVLPKLETKEHLFVSRLVTFNETFASKTPGDLKISEKHSLFDTTFSNLTNTYDPFFDHFSHITLLSIFISTNTIIIKKCDCQPFTLSPL